MKSGGAGAECPRETLFLPVSAIFVAETGKKSRVLEGLRPSKPPLSDKLLKLHLTRFQILPSIRLCVKRIIADCFRKLPMASVLSAQSVVYSHLPNDQSFAII